MADVEDVCRLIERAETSLEDCADCKGGMPQFCTCPPEDPSEMIRLLIDALKEAVSAPRQTSIPAQSTCCGRIGYGVCKPTYRCGIYQRTGQRMVGYL